MVWAFLVCVEKFSLAFKSVSYPFSTFGERVSNMSKYIVSARKYRPIRFDEVVGQKHVSRTLKNALKTDHLGHSFLFCGPRGVGKTTTARILAKVLNCENKTEDFEPCNTCSSCESFNRNHSFNIFELDAASNNGVDHIRDLVEQVRFPPQQGDYKVYIIDEVHMLSQSAFNAFLKTLEEPPSYAIFILATTEKHKILPTILSRCQIFDFNRVKVDDMVEHLQFICNEEGITAEESALHTIAQKADGALRDALSIFDRIVSFSGKNITYDSVTESLNILDYDTFFAFTDAMLVQDKNKVLTLFNEVLLRGFDGDQIMLGLANHFRNLMMAQNKDLVHLLDVAPMVEQQYIQQARQTKFSFLLNALNIANACDVSFRQAKNKRLHVELALLKICYLGNHTGPQQFIPSANETEEQLKKNTKPETEVKSTSTTVSQPKQEDVSDKVETKEKHKPEPEQQLKEEANPEPEVNNVENETEHEIANEETETKQETLSVVEPSTVAEPVMEDEEPIEEEQPEPKQAQIIPLKKPKLKGGNAEEVDNETVAKEPNSANRFRLSNLTSNIASRKQKKLEQEKEQKRKLEEDGEFNTEGLVDVEHKSVEIAWKKLEAIFAERGYPTLENAIQNSTIHYNNFMLTVTVVGEIAKQLVQDNYASIIDHIKRETGLQRFRMNIEAKQIDVSAKTTYTKQEQLEYIKKQNPAFQRLCDEFSLEIDYE